MNPTRRTFLTVAGGSAAAVTLLNLGCGGSSGSNAGALGLFRSLVSARAAIQGFEGQAASLVDKYKAEVNIAVDVSNTADEAFVAFYNAGGTADPTQLAAEVEKLTTQVISLVADLTSAFNQPKGLEIRAKYQTKKLSMNVNGKRISLIDILSFLQIAANTAQQFVGANPAAGAALLIANLVLSLTKQAIAAYDAAHTVDVSVFATPLAHI